jgi:hypothetical protein
MDQATARTMLSQKTKEILANEQCPEAFKWLEDVVEANQVPIVSAREEIRGRGRAGRFVTIGAVPSLAEVTLLDEQALAGSYCGSLCVVSTLPAGELNQDFWRVPDGGRKRMEERAADIAVSGFL